MRVGYMLLARYAELNADGTVSVVGGDFERVHAATYPALFPFSLVAKLEDVTPEDLDPTGRLHVQLTVEGPSGANLNGLPYIGFLEPPKSGLSAEKRAVRVMLQLGALEFPEKGRYSVRLQFGEGAKQIEVTNAVNAEISNG